MYTATTTKKDFRAGIFQITVDFTDGTETITEAFNITSEDDMNRRIEARLASLNELATLKESLVLGAWVKPVEIEPTTEVLAPTPEELKQREIDLKEVELIATLERTKREMEITELAGTNPALATKKAEFDALVNTK